MVKNCKKLCGPKLFQELFPKKELHNLQKWQIVIIMWKIDLVKFCWHNNELRELIKLCQFKLVKIVSIALPFCLPFSAFCLETKDEREKKKKIGLIWQFLLFGWHYRKEKKIKWKEWASIRASLLMTSKISIFSITKTNTLIFILGIYVKTYS